jgi:hypothetical protein
MVGAALAIGVVQAVLPLAVVRGIWWLLEDLILDRVNLPFL